MYRAQSAPRGICCFSCSRHRFSCALLWGDGTGGQCQPCLDGQRGVGEERLEWGVGERNGPRARHCHSPALLQLVVHGPAEVRGQGEEPSGTTLPHSPQSPLPQSTKPTPASSAREEEGVSPSGRGSERGFQPDWLAGASWTPVAAKQRSKRPTVGSAGRGAHTGGGKQGEGGSLTTGGWMQEVV